MEWQAHWDDPFTTYLRRFDPLIGAEHTRTSLTETVKGIITEGSTVRQRIAAQPLVFAAVSDGAQRIIRLLTGEGTKRSPTWTRTTCLGVSPSSVVSSITGSLPMSYRP